MILTSSEHSFPYRLGNPRLGFNKDSFTRIIYAGEVSPHQMLELLTTKWGVGDNLAVALVDRYGGHIYNIYLKLIQLKRDREMFDSGSLQPNDDVQSCLDFNGDKKRMRLILTQLAENGFAPLSKSNDPVAEFISTHNVGGFVKNLDAIVIGLPVDVWGKHKMGLIPSKQSIRLVIAEVLEANPEVPVVPWWRLWW